MTNKRGTGEVGAPQGGRRPPKRKKPSGPPPPSSEGGAAEEPPPAARGKGGKSKGKGRAVPKAAGGQKGAPPAQEAPPRDAGGSPKSSGGEGAPADGGRLEEGGERSPDEEGGARGGLDEEEDKEEKDPMEMGKIQAMTAEEMQKTLDRFKPEQMDQYEAYRRSAFQRASMRKLLSSVTGQQVSIPLTIVMSGIAKLFVGELVEHGRIVMAEWGDTGPLRPRHVREAFQRLQRDGKVPLQTHAPLFR